LLGDLDGLGQHHLAHDRRLVLHLLLTPFPILTPAHGGKRRAATLDHLGIAVQHQAAGTTTAVIAATSAAVASIVVAAASRRLAFALAFGICRARTGGPFLAVGRLRRRCRRCGCSGLGPGRFRRFGNGRRLRFLGLALLPLFLFLGEQAGRRLFGLLARILFGLSARLFLFLAALCRLFLSGLALALLGDPARIFLGALTGLVLHLPGVGKGAHTGILLAVGERLENHRAARLATIARLGPRAAAGINLARDRSPAGRTFGLGLGRCALAFHLDGNGLAAAMREALTHHAGIDPLLQLEAVTARLVQRDSGTFILLFRTGHDVSVVPFGSVRSRDDGSSLPTATSFSTATSGLNPASRSASRRSLSASLPGNRAACTK